MKNRNLALTVLVLTGTVGMSSCAPAALPPPAAPQWVKMPLLSPESKAAGVFPGGERS